MNASPIVSCDPPRVLLVLRATAREPEPERLLLLVDFALLREAPVPVAFLAIIISCALWLY
jgi:hypothetical protein